MPVYGCKSSCHSCPALHRRTGPLAPRDNHSLAEGHCFFTDHCLLSTALTLSVPCRPMPMVSSVDQVAAYQDCSHPASVCSVDHVLHGDYPDVMTLRSQRRTVAYYTRGELQARCYEARCVFPPWGQASPQLGPLTGPDPWGSTLPYWVYHTPMCATYVCVCLTSLPGVAPNSMGLADVGPKVLVISVPLLWRPISVLAPILGGRRQKPSLLEGRGGQVC